MALGTRSIQLKRPGILPSLEYSAKGFAIFDTSSIRPPIWTNYAAAILGILANIGYHAGESITLSCPIGFVICFQQLMKRLKGEFGTAVDKDKEKRSTAASSSRDAPIAMDIRLTLSEAIAQRLGIPQGELNLDHFISSLQYHKDVWKQYLTATTAISGAGATYSAAVYIIPGDNALTGNKAASVVGNTRAQLLTFVLLPTKVIPVNTHNGMTVKV